MDKIMKIKIQMAKLGWDVEEKISSNGWGRKIGYTVWFKRCDWHGKFTYSLTGHIVHFVGCCGTLDYESILNTIHDTAKMARKAWHDFPDSIPFQTANNKVMKDVMFFDFKDGKDYPASLKGKVHN